MVNIVVACTISGGIGINNQLPWKISDEIKMFKMITDNSVVIMGYNTWNSLPKKPLVNRFNIILTKDPNKKINIEQNYNSQDVTVFSNMDEVLSKFNSSKCFFIGGATIYNKLIRDNLVSEAHISIINDNYECDTFIDINLLRDREHEIISRQVFDKFTYMHIRFPN